MYMSTKVIEPGEELFTDYEYSNEYSTDYEAPMITP